MEFPSHVDEQALAQRLDRFEIETPSWGYADTGTRFGKFLQEAAATDAGQRSWPTRPRYTSSPAAARASPFTCCGLSAGRPAALKWRPRPSSSACASVRSTPTSFRINVTRRGSVCNADCGSPPAGCAAHAGERGNRQGGALAVPQPVVRGRDKLSGAGAHHAPETLDGRSIAGSAPGHVTRHDHAGRVQAVRAGVLPHRHRRWGMACTFAKQAGPQARVLVDTGHHLPGCNIEHIVAFLIDENMLGRFSFQRPQIRRRRPDNGQHRSLSTVPHLLRDHGGGIERGRDLDIAYMVDQSHNLKPKIEAHDPDGRDGPGAFCQGTADRPCRTAPGQEHQNIVVRKTCCATPTAPTYGRSWRSTASSAACRRAR